VAEKVVHCKKEPFDVYIGRGRGSVWGNPFKIGEDGEREEVIEKYKQWLVFGEGRLLIKRLGELEGQTLGCWCADYGGLSAGDGLFCHGQILLKLLQHRREKLVPRN
jgi:hypothetical protein